MKKILLAACMVFSVLVLLLSPALCPGQEVEPGKKPAAGVQEAAPENSATTDATAPAEEGQPPQSMSLLQLVKYGGIVGHTIILLSFVALGLAIEYAITIRPSKLAPPKDIAIIRKLIREEKFAELKKLESGKTSYLTRVVIAGLNEMHLGYGAVIKAMEDASEALSARFARKVEHLNVISNVAPMLGLLGTVTGMLRCFNEISQIKGTVEPQLLARGIFEALVTTVEGLIVAIPALYLFSVFRNRVDECAGQASLIAEELVTALRPENGKD